MDQAAKDFLTYDYAETKDLAKSFLTLAAAILVFSLTLSEKIVEFPKAPKRVKLVLLAAWTLLIASVILCGGALCYNSLAGGAAAHGAMPFDYEGIAQNAYILLLWSGSAFAFGLIALIGATAMAMWSRKEEDQHTLNAQSIE